MSKAIAPGWFIGAGAATLAGAVTLELLAIRNANWFDPNQEAQKKQQETTVNALAIASGAGVGLIIYGLFKILTKK